MTPRTDALREALTEAAISFRVGMPAKGNDALVAFIDLLQRRLEALGSEEAAQAVLPYLTEIIGAQQRGDTLRIADLLEYEVLERLPPQA